MRQMSGQQEVDVVASSSMQASLAQHDASHALIRVTRVAGALRDGLIERRRCSEKGKTGEASEAKEGKGVTCVGEDMGLHDASDMTG